jgi:hypothetical protein
VTRLDAGGAAVTMPPIDEGDDRSAGIKPIAGVGGRAVANRLGGDR